MNYDEARPLDSGGWHWTTMNDGHVRCAWPCKRYVGPDLPLHEMANRPYDQAEWETCEPHATREEAERHFYDACLKAVQEGDLSDWSGCRVCDEPTKKTLGNRLLGRMFQGDPLCDAHRNRDELTKLHPFSPGLQAIHS